MIDTVPIPMLLTCPMPDCGKRHIDRGEWRKKLHHTHACQYCGHVWRPCVIHTVGVRFLPGFKNVPKRKVYIASKIETFKRGNARRIRDVMGDYPPSITLTQEQASNAIDTYATFFDGCDGPLVEVTGLYNLHKLKEWTLACGHVLANPPDLFGAYPKRVPCFQCAK